MYELFTARWKRVKRSLRRRTAPFTSYYKGRKGLTMNKYTKFRLVGELDATISAKLLYLVLLDVIDEENKIVIPQKRISAALGISKNTVSRNMHRLERIGAIRIVPQFDEYGGQKPNKFILEG